MQRERDCSADRDIAGLKTKKITDIFSITTHEVCRRRRAARIDYGVTRSSGEAGCRNGTSEIDLRHGLVLVIPQVNRIDVFLKVQTAKLRAILMCLVQRCVEVDRRQIK